MLNTYKNLKEALLLIKTKDAVSKEDREDLDAMSKIVYRLIARHAPPTCDKCGEAKFKKNGGNL